MGRPSCPVIDFTYDATAKLTISAGKFATGRDEFDKFLIARYDGRIATRPIGDTPGEKYRMSN